LGPLRKTKTFLSLVGARWAFRVDGGTGHSRPGEPADAEDAERVVTSIEGVDRVIDRYALQTVPSIHIIVKNGSEILEGVATDEGDKNIADIQALQAPSVPGALSVE